MPYSRHSSRKLSVFIALRANSLLWFIWFLVSHGILLSAFSEPGCVTYVLNHFRYPCPEPAPSHFPPLAAVPCVSWKAAARRTPTITCAMVSFCDRSRSVASAPGTSAQVASQSHL